MPGPQPPRVPLSEAERQELHDLIRAHNTPQHSSFRAHLLLLLAASSTAPEVARRLGTSRRTGRRWRRPWLARPHRAVTERVPGAPATCGAEQWCPSSARACEPPEASGRPSSPGTPRALADAACQRGLGERISARHVGRFFQSGRPQTAPQSRWAQERARRGGRHKKDRAHHPLLGGAGLA